MKPVSLFAPSQHQFLQREADSGLGPLAPVAQPQPRLVQQRRATLAESRWTAGDTSLNLVEAAVLLSMIGFFGFGLLSVLGVF